MKLSLYIVKSVTAACTFQFFEKQYVLRTLRALRLRSVPLCRSTKAMLTARLGVAFRVRDKAHYYLVALDEQRKFRVLAVKDGDRYTVLDRRPAGYSRGAWHELRVVMRGTRLEVYIDGRKELSAEDATLKSGTLALYSWGSTGVRFRKPRFEGP